MPPTYHVHPLPGQAFAVIDDSGKTWGVSDRKEDAERIAYALSITDASEETAKRDEAVQS